MDIKNQILSQIDLEHNFDVYYRKIKVSFGMIDLLFLTPLVDSILLMETIKSIKQIRNKTLIQEKLSTPQVKYEEDVNALLNFFYYGEVLIFYRDLCFHADCKKLPVRSIDEPYSEKAIRGSRDGFNENLNTNIGLIRLRIKSPELCSDILTVSKYSQISVCLVYLKDQADLKIVNELKKRISSLKINSLIMTDRSLEEKLFSQSKVIYPLARYTERPDVASVHIMNGKIAIIVDTSSSVLITPVCLLDHLKHVEEFRQTPIIGTFTKILRIIAIILSLFLSPTILALYIDHDINNIFILTSQYKAGDLAFHMVGATVLLEIFRIAVVHTPTPLVSAISLVSALVLSQVSIELGIFSSEILLVVSISTICGFATPSYELSLSNKLMSLIFILVVAIFKIEGFLICLIILFLYLVSIRIFNLPYLYPLFPFDLKKLTNFFIRTSSDDKKNL